MKPQVVSFHCILKTKLGKLVSSTFNNEVLTVGGQHDLLTGLVAGLQNLTKGEKRTIRVPAAQAYGYYDLAKVIQRPLEEFNGKLRLGSRVSVLEGGQKAVYRVTELSAEVATLDANHPLAGEDLVFEIEATAAREARADELVSELDESLLH